MTSASPLRPFLDGQGFMILDGGLATELERRGQALDTPLWSAHLLDSKPALIRDVHRSYLEAGADCIITASYQASVDGFMANGYSRREAETLLQKSVTLACEARDRHVASNGEDPPAPLVAASIGPYGAYLANGAEYTGDYGVSFGALVDFHRSRWEILAGTGADLFACETLPSLEEAQVLLQLLDESKDIRAWFSFSCRDATRISDGAAIRECAGVIGSHDRIVAIGVNCTQPRFVPDLITELTEAAPRVPIIVYPNSGEHYDGGKRGWTGESDAAGFGEHAKTWYQRGARIIGGCCRTGPEHIRAARRALESMTNRRQ